MGVVSKNRLIPALRHFSGNQMSAILRYKGGDLVSQKAGASFWFRPRNTQIAEVPMALQEVTLVFKGRSNDFQDVTVNGSLNWRIRDPQEVSTQFDFTVDVSKGYWNSQPLVAIDGLLNQLAEQFCWDYLASQSLTELLNTGISDLRDRIAEGIANDPTAQALGIEVSGVRVSGLRPEGKVNALLQAPRFEELQLVSEQAVSARRNQALDLDLAINTKTMDNQIKMENQRSQIIAEQGKNNRAQTEDQVETQKLATAAQAEMTEMKAQASAKAIDLEEGARVNAEAKKIDIYKGLPQGTLMALSLKDFAGSIGHLSITPDLASQAFAHMADIPAVHDMGQAG